MVAHFSSSFWRVRHGHIYIYIHVYIPSYIYICIYMYVYIYVCMYIYIYVYIYVCVYSSSLNDIVLLGKISPKSCYPGASRPGLSAEVGKELDTAIELWSERCGAMELPLRHATTRVVVFHPNSSWLVVWNMNFMTFHSVGNFIIPTDFHSMIFQRSRSTTNQIIINHH